MTPDELAAIRSRKMERLASGAVCVPVHTDERDDLIAEIERLRDALRQLANAGHGEFFADAPWARALIAEALA